VTRLAILFCNLILALRLSAQLALLVMLQEQPRNAHQALLLGNSVTTAHSMCLSGTTALLGKFLGVPLNHQVLNIL
jgi:hypothetical protein